MPLFVALGCRLGRVSCSFGPRRNHRLPQTGSVTESAGVLEAGIPGRARLLPSRMRVVGHVAASARREARPPKAAECVTRPAKTDSKYRCSSKRGHGTPHSATEYGHTPERTGELPRSISPVMFVSGTNALPVPAAWAGATGAAAKQ